MAGSDEKTRRVGIPALVVILTISSLNVFTVGIAPILPLLEQHFASTPGAGALVRMLLTAAGGALIIGAPAGAYFSERVSERSVLIISLLLFAVSGSAGFFVDDLWLLLVSRICVGISLGAASVAAMTLLTFSVAPEAREKWIGFYTAFGVLGGLVVMPLIGLLGDIQWRLAFLLHLVAAPLALAALVLLPRERHTRAAKSAKGGDACAFPYVILLISLASGALVSSPTVYLPFHLAEIGVTDPGVIALALFASAASGGLAALNYGLLRSHLDQRKTFALAFSFSAVGLIIIAAGAGSQSAIVGMCFVGASTGLLGPNVFSLAAAAPLALRARYLGIVKAAFYSAPLVAQFPLEPLVTAHGANAGIIALCIFAAIMIAAILVLRRPQPQAASS